MKCFRLRCCVNNSFLVIHQGNQTLENNKTLALHARVSYRFLVFHTLMKHSNSLFTYNFKDQWTEDDNTLDRGIDVISLCEIFVTYTAFSICNFLYIYLPV